MEFLLLLVLILVIVAVGGGIAFSPYLFPAARRGPGRRARRFSTLSERLLPDDCLAINRWSWADVVETASDN